MGMNANQEYCTCWDIYFIFTCRFKISWSNSWE